MLTTLIWPPERVKHNTCFMSFWWPDYNFSLICMLPRNIELAHIIQDLSALQQRRARLCIDMKLLMKFDPDVRDETYVTHANLATGMR